MSSLPDTSLIICSRDRPELLAETVASVLAGDAVPTEIVIVDQSVVPHPTLPTLTSQACAIRYIPSRSIGLCRARNEAVAAARYELLAFTDDDMRAEPAWYGTLLRALIAARPRAVVTGRVLAAEPDRPGGFAPALVDSPAPAQYAGRIWSDVLAAGHMAMERSAIAEVGPFDERLGAGGRFPAADDNEFGYRLLEAGYRIVYEPRAVLYHRAWRTSRDFLPLRWSYGRGKGGFYAKHLSLRDPYILGRLTWDLGRRVLWLPYRILRRQQRAIGDIVYGAGVLRGLVEWLWTELRRP